MISDTSLYYLARLDDYGNATLVDGAHSGPEGARGAARIFKRIGHMPPGVRFAVVRVEVVEEMTAESTPGPVLGVLGALLAKAEEAP